MPPPVTVEILDRMRPNLASLVMERAKRLPGMVYCDLRLQVKEEKSAVAENGNAKASSEDYVFDFGVRVIAGVRLSAPGYYGRILGQPTPGISRRLSGTESARPISGLGPTPASSPRPRDDLAVWAAV